MTQAEIIIDDGPFRLADELAIQRLVVNEPNRGVPATPERRPSTYDIILEQIKTEELAASVKDQEANGFSQPTVVRAETVGLLGLKNTTAKKRQPLIESAI